MTNIVGFILLAMGGVVQLGDGVLTAVQDKNEERHLRTMVITHKIVKRI